MLAGGAMKAFEFLNAGLLPALLPKAVILDPMLAGLPRGLKRCPTRASLVRRESVFASSGGEVIGDGQDPVPRESEATEGAETRGQTFGVLNDVGDEEDAPVNVYLGLHTDPGDGMRGVGQNLGYVHGGVELANVGGKAGGVGGVHFLRSRMIYCRKLCLNPSLPPYLRRSASSPLSCVFYPLPYQNSLAKIKTRSDTQLPSLLPGKTLFISLWANLAN
jgi:hypothetical protein